MQPCSALAGGGKTTSTSALVLAACNGPRALCVDAGFRHPTLLQRGARLPASTVNDVLNGPRDSHGAIEPDALVGAHLIS